MRIAVYIQNKDLRGRFALLFDRYRAQCDPALSCLFFETDIDLYDNLIGGEYDAIFLEIPNNPTDLISEIREKDHLVRLIPVATAAQWTETEYGSEVWYCLPALVSEGFLFALLGRLAADLKRDSDVGLVIKSRQGIVHILFSDLEYVEVVNKTICFYLSDGKTVEVTAPLAEYEPRLLGWPDFIKVHRAYIVNLRHVQRLEPGFVVTHSGQSVPVSKYLYPELRKDYLSRLSDPGTVSEKTPSPDPAPSAVEGGGYRILLVDDEAGERDYWSRLLEQKGCVVVGADCGAAAMHAAADGSYDCVLLDVMLGDEKGFDLCAALHEQTGAPVIFLSTKSDLDSQVEGFQVGGMDYITKDTEDELFWVKVKARIGGAGAGRTALRFGPLRIDLNQRQAQMDADGLALTTVEFDLLCLLAQRAGEVCTPEEIYRSLWDDSQGSGSQSVQMQMSRLRRKLEKACPDQTFIETVWGKGYRFLAPDRE